MLALRSRLTLALTSVGLLSGLTGLTGCASYQHKVDSARQVFSSNPGEAAAKLEPLAKEDSKDQLVYLLDYATALQMADRPAESAKAFGEADRMADLKDYHSVSRVAGSLVLNEEMVQYKGDDFEKVLISGMNALNYLEMGDLDEALVEVRRVNQKLLKLKSDGKQEFNQSPYAFYLGAMLWEADRKYDDAYISYADAYSVAPNYLPLREDLIRAAIRADRQDELAKWKKAFPEVKIKPEWKDRNRSEIVLVFLNGWGPRKYPRPDSPRFPKLVPVMNPVSAATMNIAEVSDGKKSGGGENTSVMTTRLYSVDEIAVKALDADVGRLMASRLAGIATKAVVADQISQKDKMLGAVAWIAMNVADRADLRQWSTLPQSFQVARASVPAGKYKVTLKAIGSSKEKVVDVDVKPGRKAFLVWRVVD